MLKRKQCLALLLALIMIFTVVGCGQNNNNATTNEGTEASTDEASTDDAATDDADDADDTDEAEAPVATGEPVEIRFSWWGSEERNAIYNAITDLYEEANPHVTVLREPASWEDFWIRLATQSAGGNAPTVFGMNPQYSGDYALRGALASLEPFIADGTIDLTDIPAAVVEGGRIEDDIVMVSQGITAEAYLLNSDLMKQYDIAYPAFDEDWTWEEFAQTAKDYAAVAEGSWLSGPMDGHIAHFQGYTRQGGEEFYTEDGNIGFRTEKLIEWWNYWKDLRDADAVPPQTEWAEDGQNPLEQRMLATGRVVLGPFPANQIELWQTANGGTFDLVRPPVGPNDVALSGLPGGSFFAVSSSATPEEQAAGAALIDFFVNNGEAIDIFLMEQGIPANTKMGERIIPQLSEAQGKAVEFVNAILPLADTDTSRDQPLGATEIEQLFGSFADQIVYGMMDIETAAHQFAEEAQAILDRED